MWHAAYAVFYNVAYISGLVFIILLITIIYTSRLVILSLLMLISERATAQFSSSLHLRE